MSNKLRITLRSSLTYLVALIAIVALLTSCSDSTTGPGSAGPTGSMIIQSQRDTDGDGLIDLDDSDDDNDGQPDDMDDDDDNDGIPDDLEEDSDNDGTINDHDDDFVELKGTISAKGASQITVFGRTVFYQEGTTRLEGENDMPITFADLAVGMRVEVDGILNGDGSIVAVEIEVEDDHEDEIPPSQLQVGQYVEARGVKNGGQWMLLEVVHHEADNQFEYEGDLEANGATSVMLGGVEFEVDGLTEYRDDAETGKSLAELVEGDRVDIKATYNPVTEVFHADRIRTESDDDTRLKVEATVFSVNTSEGILVVGGVTFHF